MQKSTFNALPIVDTRQQALVLSIGTFFLFTEDASQQNNPNINRITYWERIKRDKFGGPFPLPSSILKNFTHVSFPISGAGGRIKGIRYIAPSAGGPFPPSGAGYSEIFPPAEGVIKGQGSRGYVKVFDFFENEPSSLSSSSTSSSSSSSLSSSSSSSSSSLSSSSSTSAVVLSWLDYTDISYWTETGFPAASNPGWDGSKYVIAVDTMILTPNGGWEVGFRPTKVRITWTDVASGGLALTLNTGIVSTLHSMTNPILEETLDFSSGDLVNLTTDGNVKSAIYDVTKIEFYG
jgi:hypothetical protein